MSDVSSPPRVEVYPGSGPRTRTGVEPDPRSESSRDGRRGRGIGDSHKEPQKDPMTEEVVGPRVVGSVPEVTTPDLDSNL